MSRSRVVGLLVFASFSPAYLPAYAQPKPRDKIVTAEGRASGTNANAMEQARMDEETGYFEILR